MLITHLVKVLLATVTLYLSTRNVEYSDGYSDGFGSERSDLLIHENCEVLHRNTSTTLQRSRVLVEGDSYDRSGSGVRERRDKGSDGKDKGVEATAEKGSIDKGREIEGSVENERGIKDLKASGDKSKSESGNNEKADRKENKKSEGKAEKQKETKAEDSGKKKDETLEKGTDKKSKDKTGPKGNKKNKKDDEAVRGGGTEVHNDKGSDDKKKDKTLSETGIKQDKKDKTIKEEETKDGKQFEIPSQGQNQTRIRFCGVVDENEEEITGNTTGLRFKRYIRHGKIWKKSRLTWTLRTPSSRTRELPEGIIRREMIAAMRLWEQETTVVFQEVHKESRDIDIYIDFAMGDHGDNNKFDGKGGTLAHAYYPGEGIGGDMHFDDAENFTPHEDSVQYKSNSLLVTAAHELGHALGLSHSDVGEALMAPWYQTFPKDFNKLPLDDRRGIQALYGKPEVPEPTEIQTLPPRPTRPPRPKPTTTTTTTKRPTPKPTRPTRPTERPRPTIRPPPPTERPPPPTERPPPPTEAPPPSTERPFPPTERTLPPLPTGIPPKPTLGPPQTTPKPVKPTEPTHPQTTPNIPIPPCPVHPKPTDVPDTCDTDFDAVTVYRREIYFFKDKFYWRISRMGRLYENEAPHVIHALFPGLPREVDHIEAAYENKDDNIVFISGGKYYELDKRHQLYETGTLLSRGVNATRINGGMIWSYNGRVYLFSKTHYWRLDYDDKAEIDYPRGIEVWKGLPPNFSGALSYKAKTYFFAGRVFWVFNPMEMKLADPPLVTATYWFSCPHRNQNNLFRCAITSGQSSILFTRTLRLYFVTYVIATLHNRFCQTL